MKLPPKFERTEHGCLVRADVLRKLQRQKRFAGFQLISDTFVEEKEHWNIYAIVFIAPDKCSYNVEYDDSGEYAFYGDGAKAQIECSEHWVRAD